MTKILTLIVTLCCVLAMAGEVDEAAASCSHLNNAGTCPPGIPDGSTSISFLPGGFILWSNGAITAGNQCCPPPSGVETGQGLINLNPTEALFGDPFDDDDGGIALFGQSQSFDDDEGDFGNLSPFEDNIGTSVGPGLPLLENSCDAASGSCNGGVAGTLFGDGVNAPLNAGSCDFSGGGCSGDLWKPVALPESICAPFCGLGGDDTGWINTQQNATGPGADPFGAPGVYVDPKTGQSYEVDTDNPDSLPPEIRAAWDARNAQLDRQFQNEAEDRKQMFDFLNNRNAPGGVAGTLTYPGQQQFTTYVDIVLETNGELKAADIPQVATDPAIYDDDEGGNAGKYPLNTPLPAVVFGQNGYVVRFSDGHRSFYPTIEEADAAIASGAAATAAPPAPPPAAAPGITGTPVATLDDVIVNGRNYGKVEIINGPDGKPHAVGTGAFAGHDFGEAKQSSSGFGWRPEGGPWVAPPPPDASAMRQSVSGEDAQQVGRILFTDGFESGDTSAWSTR